MEISKELVEKYVNGTCTNAERQLVEQAILEKDDAWFAGIGQQMLPTAGVSDIAKEERQRLQRHIGGMAQKPVRRYVAVLLLLLGGAVYFIIINNRSTGSSMITLSNLSSVSAKKLLLADSTVVYLNAYARISYNPVQFNKLRREVRLEGEAYFEVAHNPTRPFVVYAKGTTITVKGTKFNVEAYKNEKEVHVTLLEGRVVVREKNEQVVLQPNQRVTVDTHENFLVRQGNAKAHKNWTENEEDIFFDNVSLQAALNRIATLYGLSIKVDTLLLEDKYIQGQFIRENADTLLKKLLFIHGLHYTKTGSYTIVITEK